MSSILFYAALTVSVVGLAVALRFLFMAWSDHRFRRQRRASRDRRQEDLTVPMERRKANRRH